MKKPKKEDWISLDELIWKSVKKCKTAKQFSVWFNAFLKEHDRNLTRHLREKWKIPPKSK